MKCVIPGPNVKILARAIHVLGKIGEEMYVQPQERALSFRSVSMSNSAYCDFTFRDNYFTYYKFGDLDEEDTSKCKVSMRCAISVFKTPGIMDKLIETCHINLESNASTLIIILKYKNSVIKTFLLPILNCEALQAAYNKDGAPNQLIVQPKVLADALQNFQQNLVEMTLDVSEEKILIRNYVNETSGSGNATRTQLALAIDEFNTYKIGQETCVTFCMKEVRAILAFADTVGIPLHIFFELAGRPIVFVLRNPGFEANLVLSTLNPEPLDVPDTTIQDRREALKKRNVRQRTATKQLKSRKKINNKSTASAITNAANSILRPGRHNVKTNMKNPQPTREVPQESDANSLIPLVRSTSINNQDKDISMNAQQASTSNLVAQLPKSCTNFVAETPSSFGSTQCLHIFTSESDTSMFSSPSSRRRIHEMAENNSLYTGDEETVPDSPPPPVSKKAKLMFRKCFQATFDPRMLPGHDKILMGDSDSE
ncbi:hypothetical protein PV327_005412 [Microctonus hyperodae]|uniref:Cell cycle checkpoint control protein RAD9A n=1 Tax=Microctonus hyperodae TaxID=165561 RepID=A0AA39KZT2_MICHY|nr:hypothetical protein PV327_005412 [Microctonus hyperodae]